MKTMAGCSRQRTLHEVRPTQSKNTPETDEVLVGSRLLTNNVLFANSMRELSQVGVVPIGRRLEQLWVVLRSTYSPWRGAGITWSPWVWFGNCRWTSKQQAWCLEDCGLDAMAESWQRKVGSPAAMLESSKIMWKGQEVCTVPHCAGQGGTILSPRKTGQ